MDKKIIDLELEILVLKYGREKVVEALSRIEGKTMEDIEKWILAAKRPKKRKSRIRKTGEEILNDKIRRVGESKKTHIAVLAESFLNGSFLETTKEIEDFFTSSGMRTPSRSSRKDKLVRLIDALDKLPNDELHRLVEYRVTKSNKVSLFGEFASQLVDPKE